MGDEKPKAPTLGEALDALGSSRVRTMFPELDVLWTRWREAGEPEHDYPEGWPAGEWTVSDLLGEVGIYWLLPKCPEPQSYTVKASEVDPAKHRPAEGGRWGIEYSDGGDPLFLNVIKLGCVTATFGFATHVEVIDREPQR